MTVLFGTLFSDIKINRDASDNTVEQIIKVPLSYGPTDKTLARVREQPELETQVGIVLPRMSFELVDIQYAAERKLGNLLKVHQNDSFTYSPVPYDYYFRLYIMHNQMVDGTRILEQILPFFTPQLNVPATILPELGQVADIGISLQGVLRQDEYEGQIENRRTQIWTLGFVVKGYMFGPIYTGGLIKKIEANFYSAINSTIPDETLSVYPGLTANGLPTSNSSLTIPYQDIEEDDNWGFIIDIERD